MCTAVKAAPVTQELCPWSPRVLASFVTADREATARDLGSVCDKTLRGDPAIPGLPLVLAEL